MALPIENQWANPHERLSFRTIFKSVTMSFLRSVSYQDMIHGFDGEDEPILGHENEPQSFLQQQGRLSGLGIPPHVDLGMPKSASQQNSQVATRPEIEGALYSMCHNIETSRALTNIARANSVRQADVLQPIQDPLGAEKTGSI